jgi:hypothetical protein
MSAGTARLLVFLAGGTAALLFLAQSAAWTLFRLRRLAPRRWRTLARALRVAALVLFAAGAALVIAEDPVGRSIAHVALLGGGLNALIATLHLRVAAVFGSDREPPRPGP